MINEKDIKDYKDNEHVQPDPVNHPKHYTSHPSGIEAIQITEHMSFLMGNAMKYYIRYPLKNGLEDLQKCQWYLNKALENALKEEWKSFPSDPRYEVSSQGKIRSRETGFIRKPVTLKNGYSTFMVVLDGKHRLFYVHRAVVQAFLGDIPEDMQVCHYDGNKENNSIKNLRIDTSKNNHKDKKRHHTDFAGGRNPAVKLTLEEVSQIRAQPDRTQVDLAVEYGVSRAAIGRIRRGESWVEDCENKEDIFQEFVSHETGNSAEILNAIWRADLKNGVEDLQKAAFYINREIENRIKQYDAK